MTALRCYRKRLWGAVTFFLTSSLIYSSNYIPLYFSYLYFCVPRFWGTQK